MLLCMLSYYYVCSFLFVVMGLVVSYIVMYAVLLLCVFCTYIVMRLLDPDIVMYAVLLLCMFGSVYFNRVSSS
jgi:hypothetical protein